ncbi:MAG: tRNA 2-thiocytidine biosynthesis TtcA family protein [Anaerolineae bacterium]
MLKSINRAVREFNLIVDGDRIAVGVSGGKDSRVLLDMLLRGVDIPGTYSVVAVHVDGTEVGLPNLVPTLEPWFRELGVEYDIAPLTVPDDESLPMDCFRCTFNRRKALFFAAERLGCNKVALGHHADDAAVTTLMNIGYTGQLNTLEPRRDFFAGRVTVIRPLIYTTEKEIARYAHAQGWVFPPELACPRAADTRRAKFERFLATFKDKERAQIRANLWQLCQRIERIPTDFSSSADLAD